MLTEATTAPVTFGQQQIEERDVMCQIRNASAVFQRLKLIWAATTISIKTKVHLFNSIVIPMAIYAAEMWKTSAT